MLTLDKTQLFSHIVEQHVNDAAFLWILRAQAVSHTQQTTAAISKLELRINKHLQGLSMAPNCAWEYALQAAEFKESGEVFVLAMLAFTSGENNKINIALELGMDSKETLKGLVSALGWLSSDIVYPLLGLWIQSDNLMLRYLSVATCSLRRLDPQDYLNTLFNDQHSLNSIPLFSRMLRLVGELKRHDLAPALVKAQIHENAEVVFWAHWSALLLGDRTAISGIKPYVLRSGPLQARAIDIAFRLKAHTDVWAWLNQLITIPGQMQQSIKALATLGDPHGINWLLVRMEEPALAKLAGEAFSTITGIDLDAEGLVDTQRPNTSDIDAANEISDDIPVVDEHLPSPDVEKVSQHWQQIRHNFSAGQRYFLGQPIEFISLKQILSRGLQQQRLAAAMELALLSPEQAYPNAKTPFSQMGKL